MFSTCACDYGDYETPVCYWSGWITTLTEHECEECHETIPSGSRVFWVATQMAGEPWYESAVCERCETIRQEMCPCACIGGLYYEIEAAYDMTFNDVPKGDPSPDATAYW